MADEGALHPIGMEQIPPRWVDGRFAQPVDLLPCSLQPVSQRPVGSKAQIVSEIDRHVRQLPGRPKSCAGGSAITTIIRPTTRREEVPQSNDV
jgi:hypothetical protein